MLSQNLLPLFGIRDCPRIVVNIGGASVMGGKAHGAFRRFLTGTAVVYTGKATAGRLVAAVNAKFCPGGYNLSAFGTSF